MRTKHAWLLALQLDRKRSLVTTTVLRQSTWKSLSRKPFTLLCWQELSLTSSFTLRGVTQVLLRPAQVRILPHLTTLLARVLTGPGSSNGTVFPRLRAVQSSRISSVRFGCAAVREPHMPMRQASYYQELVFNSLFEPWCTHTVCWIQCPLFHFCRFGSAYVNEAGVLMREAGLYCSPFESWCFDTAVLYPMPSTLLCSARVSKRVLCR